MRSLAFQNTPKLHKVCFHPETSGDERFGGVTYKRMTWNCSELVSLQKRRGALHPIPDPCSLQIKRKREHKPQNVPKDVDEGMSHLEICLRVWTTVRDQRETQLAP